MLVILHDQPLGEVIDSVFSDEDLDLVQALFVNRKVAEALSRERLRNRVACFLIFDDGRPPPRTTRRVVFELRPPGLVGAPLTLVEFYFVWLIVPVLRRQAVVDLLLRSILALGHRHFLLLGARLLDLFLRLRSLSLWRLFSLELRQLGKLRHWRHVLHLERYN